MAIISQLFVYPVKSCAGLTLTEAVAGHAGLETPAGQAQSVADREWMIVTAAGDFLTQREHPRMALIVPSVEPGARTGAGTDRNSCAESDAESDAESGTESGAASGAASGALRLRAPGMPDLLIPLGGFALRAPSLPVRVWDHHCAAFDEGDAAREWLSDFLHTSARLARFDPAHARWSNQGQTGTIKALNRFSDGYPLLLLSEASLTQLNERLQEAGREPLPVNRFRPNIVIKGVEAHDEDHLAALRSRPEDAPAEGAPEIELRPVKPCPRCPVPSVDQATGMRGANPLDILAHYRGSADGIVFGQNVIVASGFGALLRTGQRLDEEWNF